MFNCFQIQSLGRSGQAISRVWPNLLAHMHCGGGKCFCMHRVVPKSTSMRCGTTNAPHVLWWGEIPLDALWWGNAQLHAAGGGGGGNPPARPMVGQEPLPCLFGGMLCVGAKSCQMLNSWAESAHILCGGPKSAYMHCGGARLNRMSCGGAK